MNTQIAENNQKKLEKTLEIFKKHNINIVRIPYTKNVTDNYIKQYLSQFILELLKLQSNWWQ